MKTEVRFGTLNFVITGFVAAAINLDARIFAEKPESKSKYFPIFTLI
jgi:hypothetical protein